MSIARPLSVSAYAPLSRLCATNPRTAIDCIACARMPTAAWSMPVAAQNRITRSCALSFVVSFAMFYFRRPSFLSPRCGCGRIFLQPHGPIPQPRDLGGAFFNGWSAPDVVAPSKVMAISISAIESEGIRLAIIAAVTGRPFSPSIIFIASRCPYRKSNPHVLMVQTSEVWGGHDTANGLHSTRRWCILVQR